MRPQDVKTMLDAVYSRGTIGVNVADGDLLILAALSNEVAERVVEYRPRIRELVQRVRADPAAFLADVRRSYGTDELPR